MEGGLVEVHIEHFACDGTGEIVYTETRIDPKHQSKHLREHAYKRPPETSMNTPPIGANCDCPRVTVKKKRSCIGCKGRGKEILHLAVPSTGDKVEVRDARLLRAIFGDEIPVDPGIVFDTQTPEQHHMELRTGYGVRVTWDRLNKQFKIPKNKEIELWTFDLSELRIV